MDGQRGAERGDLPSEERRRAALVAFIGAGMPSPPSAALLVAALAGARRAVAMHQACGLAIDEWLAGEVRLRGIRENAAILAVLEMPGRREEIAQAYRRQHPDRVGTLSDLLAVLDLPGPAAFCAGSVGSRWPWFEPQAGLGEEGVDEAGPVLDGFEPVLDDRGELVHVGGGQVAQAVFHVRPGALSRFVMVHASLDSGV
jgi:hypothetical protein